jgi:threonine-phosphate decarboxylase
MTVAAHGGDIYQNQITYDFSVNTNPLPLPEILQKRMAEAAVHSNRYPQYDNVLLRERLAAFYGFSAEEVVCGNGASELFVAIVHALRPKRVGILAPSFSGYAWAAQTVGAEVCSIPLREENNFAMDMAQMESLCRHLDGIGLLFLANPANPVGNKMEASLLETLLDVCEKRRITVVLDECFIAFTGMEGYVSWIRKYPHLIVVRAYTKIYAIPGIRLGYLLAQKDICEKIAHQLPEWNVSVVAQRIGMDILNDSLPGWSRRKYLKDTIGLIQQEKHFLKHELTKIFGDQMKIFPSEANFLLLKTQIPLYRLLLERGILIRNCANYTGLGQDFYRIAVKGHPENVQLIEALLDIKKKGEEKRYGKH